jgi:GMP synthase-like glutamine amidotransferase
LSINGGGSSSFPPLVLDTLLQRTKMEPKALEFVRKLIEEKKLGGGSKLGPHCAALDNWMDTLERDAKSLTPTPITLAPHESLACDAVMRRTLEVQLAHRQVLRVGIIDCSVAVDVYGRTYGARAWDWLSESRPAHVELRVTLWNAMDGVPSLHEWSQCDLIVCMGSPSAAYDTDPWILRLGEWLREIVLHSQVHLVGICFGHQLIAHVCGGLAELNPVGVEAGLSVVKLNDAGALYFGNNRTSFRLLMSHGDIVSKIPTGASLLAANEFGAQIYCIGERVLCLQGHPEFCIADAIMCAKNWGSRINLTEVLASIERYGDINKGDEKWIGKWIIEWSLKK